MPYTVRAGKQKVSCHRLKRHATKKAKALRAAGRKKVRVSKVKTCR